MISKHEAELLLAAHAAGISSPKELANFMAQVSLESTRLTRLEEGFRYTRGLQHVPVKAVRNNPEEGEPALREALDGNPERLAELMYGGRMGNVDPGDGYKFRGRGYIQLTGRTNYEIASKALGAKLSDDPDLVATHEYAAKTSIHYWQINVHAKAAEDVDRATYIINERGLGLEERRQYFSTWQERLTPEVMAGLAAGEVIIPISPEFTPKRHSGRSSLASGDEVRALQAQLSDLGYTGRQGDPLKVDGAYGQDTKAAVHAFQRDHGLAQDGVAGSKTLSALHRLSPPVFQWRLDDPDHPDHSLYLQARNHVHQLDQKHGRSPDQLSDNLAASLTASAHADGLERIDQIALSDDKKVLWASQRPPGARDHFWDKFTHVEVVKSLHTSIEESSQQWALADETVRQRGETQVQQQSLEQAPGAIRQEGPTIRR